MQTQPTKEEALQLDLKQATDTIKKLEAMLARTDGRFNCQYEQPVSVGALEKALTIFDSLVWYRMDTTELFYKNREEAVKQIMSMALLAKEEEIKALREALEQTWISVKDKTPEPNVKVKVKVGCTGMGGTTSTEREAMIKENGRWTVGFDWCRVTHWKYTTSLLIKQP